ncbi:unnamed protein product [Caenorhabditis nigoni]
MLTEHKEVEEWCYEMNDQGDSETYVAKLNIFDIRSFAGQHPGASSRSTDARRAKCVDGCRRSPTAIDILYFLL